MSIRDTATIKSWFEVGDYPTEAQFSDMVDSFWHKDEDKILIPSVAELPERLNGKYNQADGEALERKTQKVIDDLDAHKKEYAEEVVTIHSNLEELATEDERLAGVIAGETARATGEEAAIRQEFADADMQERTTREQKDAETLQSAKDYTDAIRHDERAIREEAEQTVLTSAQRYTDVNLAAESADREAADKDVLEQAKQHTETGIAAERVVREAAEREIREAISAYVDQKVAELVNGSPEALDTLLEISEALGNNPNFAADILAKLGGKVDKVEGKGLSTEDYTTTEKSKLASIADGATAVSVKRELGSGTKIATITINDVAYDLYCQTSVNVTYSAGAGINLDGTKFSLSPSGVIEGTYGPAIDVEGTDGQTISIPQITVDPYGRVTSVTNRILTNKNTTYGAATQSVAGLMPAADKEKLDGIASGANNYTHPSAHPASMIQEDATRRFVSDSEKTSWNSAVSQLGDIAAALDKING